MSSSSEDDDEDSFHEGTNQTVINGEIDFITSVIEDQLKMSGAKRSETDFIEDETSDISDVSGGCLFEYLRDHNFRLNQQHRL